MSEMYEAVLNATTVAACQQLLAEFTTHHGINRVFNGHTLLSAALLSRNTRLIPFLLQSGSDPRIVSRIKLNSMQIVLYHGDQLLDVLKLLLDTSLYYLDLSVVDRIKCHIKNSAVCAYIEAVRLEQENPVPVMQRLGALLAPRQYALSLPEKEKEKLAEEIQTVLGVYGNIRRVFFHPLSSASRMPQVIARVTAAFLVPSAAEMASLRKLVF